MILIKMSSVKKEKRRRAKETEKHHNNSILFGSRQRLRFDTLVQAFSFFFYRVVNPKRSIVLPSFAACIHTYAMQLSGINLTLQNQANQPTSLHLQFIKLYIFYFTHRHIFTIYMNNALYVFAHTHLSP